MTGGLTNGRIQVTVTLEVTVTFGLFALAQRLITTNHLHLPPCREARTDQFFSRLCLIYV